MVGKHSAMLYISRLRSVGGLMTSTVVKHETLSARAPFTVKQKPLLPSALVMDSEKRMRSGKFRSEVSCAQHSVYRSPTSIGAMVVGVCAFSSSLCGLK